jgi:predicted 3-demethylubiquinone-9 3-methyltransferase (glyoxalase superfamily)
MPQSIYPCLWFDAKAKEAAEFYCRSFQNARITAENPFVVSFELNGYRFIGINGGPQFTMNPSVSFFAIAENSDALTTQWQQLSEGGKVMMPLGSYPWAEQYGWCQDKYGVNWQLMLSQTMTPGQIFPCFMFTQANNGKAQEAMDFYTTLFPGSGIVSTNRYQPGEPDVEGNIKHAQFTLNGVLFAIMESSGAHVFTFNEATSIVVSCDTQEEIDRYWTALTANGGEESRCGWLKDRFGVSWQIVPTILETLMTDPVKMPKVSQAFMQMKKFDIAALLKAAEA